EDVGVAVDLDVAGRERAGDVEGAGDERNEGAGGDGDDDVGLGVLAVDDAGRGVDGDDAGDVGVVGLHVQLNDGRDACAGGADVGQHRGQQHVAKRRRIERVHVVDDSAASSMGG